MPEPHPTTAAPASVPAALAHVLADGLAPSLARWSSAREKAILATGSPIGPTLEPFAHDLGILHPAGLRVEHPPRVPLPLPDPVIGLLRRLGAPVFHPAGMALGRGISALDADETLLRHELVHVAQYQRLGGHAPFMRRYIFECLHHGYHAAPLEIEARERSAPGSSPL